MEGMALWNTTIDIDFVPVVDVKRDSVDMDDSRMEFSIYARFLDAESLEWHRCCNSTLGLQWLIDRQAYANELLKTKGKLLLNEVYDMLGIPKSMAGERVGWRYMEYNPIGDNYVDFNIYNEYNRYFTNGVNVRKVLLDFNVDGVI